MNFCKRLTDSGGTLNKRRETRHVTAETCYIQLYPLSRNIMPHVVIFHKDVVGRASAGMTCLSLDAGGEESKTDTASTNEKGAPHSGT